jgi:hypothetical protein
LTFDLADASKLSLSFYGKRPGPGMRLDKLSMQFGLQLNSKSPSNAGRSVSMRPSPCGRVRGDRLREYFVAIVLREATVSAAKENGCKVGTASDPAHSRRG